MQLALGDFDQELATTRRMLERLPDEHFGWKPHEKSMSLGALGAHLVNVLIWLDSMVKYDEFDLAVTPVPNHKPENREALLNLFDKNVAVLRESLAQTEADSLGEPWTFKKGDHVIFALPKAAALRSFGISHLVHHRGQLSVYLRLLDIPVPPSYGPTADE